jgi:hypothetical protein
MEYDQAKGLYIGQLMSQSGVYQLSGHDRASISYEVESILRDEYYQLARDVEQGRVRTVTGSSPGGSSSNKIDGHDVIDMSRGQGEERARGLSLGTAIDLFSIVMPMIPGHGLGANLFKTLAMGSGISQLLDFIFGGSQPKLAVVVGGVLLVAGSKKGLKKKLMVHKNRILQRIMQNVRTSLEETEKTRDTHNTHKQISDRLSIKRARARSNWVDRMGKGDLSRPQDWRERVDSMRNRLREKKSHAEGGLWAER